MKATEALAKLQGAGPLALRTAEAMALLGADASAACKILSRLSAAGLIRRLKRGLWVVDRRADPLAVARFLTAPFPCYISLQSALYTHGMISQIPASVYVVSLARTETRRTPCGDFSIHHLAPAFFFGDEAVGDQGARMASPEKALLDFLYLGPARSRLFAALPELELPRRFSVSRARRMIRRLPAGRRRTLLQGRFEQLVQDLEPVTK